MMNDLLRTQAILAIAETEPLLTAPNADGRAPQDFFGDMVFNDDVMRATLDPEIYETVRHAIDNNQRLDTRVADAVARAMRDWAMQKGATHYAHVFYPLTGLTAEKHDAFINPGRDGRMIANFTAKQLIHGEADGSSLPSGGLRATFEARGYTAWDITSPAYLLDAAGCRTLFIPTAFFASTGAALDKKTPLLRSSQAVDRQARRILALLGDAGEHVFTEAGCEQEYFLIDRRLYLARPDLISAGRTLFGAKPPKGQEMEDQYYGAIPERVLAFMADAERELLHLGVPCKTRHNEVAPGQFEIAPIFEEANIASDHQQLVMSVLQRIALRHGMVCLLHEKPYAGVNGSGKHINWSLGTKTRGLLKAGKDPAENLHFLTFCSAVIAAVDKHGALLRSSIAHAGNDHRLGACEAPPAIISIFLGQQLTAIFEGIAAYGTAAPCPEKAPCPSIGVGFLPPLPNGDGDRNRTSPFAFTGGKFEFRAVGSSQAVAGPIMILNAIIAEALETIAGDLETRLAEKADVKTAVYATVADIWKKHSRIVFNGDNYNQSWVEEAERRGLPHLRDSVEAIHALVSPEAIETMLRTGVLTERELRARHEIYLERYVNDIGVESRLTVEMARTLLLPAAMEDLGRRAAAIKNLKDLGLPVNTSTLEKLAGWTASIHPEIEALENALAQTQAIEEPLEQARFTRDVTVPAMNRVREVADKLEAHANDRLWPLPTYQEMLFIR